MDPLDRLLIEHVAANAVDSVGGVADHRPFAQGLRRLLNQAGLRIVRINLKYHAAILFAGGREGKGKLVAVAKSYHRYPSP
jgi:hypothetical protein